MEVDLRQYARSAWRGVIALVQDVFLHNLPQLSASLTYFTVLSLFPALIVVVGMLGMIGLPPETLNELLAAVGERTQSQWAVEIVEGVVTSVFASSSTSVFVGIGAIASLWSASAYVRSFMWASDGIYGVETSRSYWRGLPVRLGLALLLITLFTAAVAMVTFLGPLSSKLASALGLEGSALFAWTRASSPLLLVVTLFMLALLYKFAPSRRQPHILHLLVGAVVTVLGWGLASAGFSFYLANFAKYNRVYGTLATAIAFLVWAWILNIAVLVGVEVNRALEGKPGEEEARPEQGDDTPAPDHDEPSTEGDTLSLAVGSGAPDDSASRDPSAPAGLPPAAGAACVEPEAAAAPPATEHEGGD